MCIICTLWKSEKLSRFEASQALNELIDQEHIDPVHAVEVWDNITIYYEPEHDLEDKDESLAPTHNID